jgi:hypothetical protein
MSHFAVMVIGEDVEAQLQPFHEFECTGMNDEYVQDIHVTDEILQDLNRFTQEGKENPLQEALEWHGLENKVVENENEIDILDTHKYRYVVVHEGKLVKSVRRTNPNAKWDWFQVGGRWTGFLKLKPSADGEIGEPGLMTEPAKEGWVDVARKGDVDWEGMMSTAAGDAGEKWDSARAIAPNDWETWESVRGRFSDIDRAREVYNDQPQVQALRKDDPWSNPDSFLQTRERYVELARKAAVAPFAILQDGEWVERGEMGWFAVISNDTGEETWCDKAWEIIQSLPDDELITMVDCHI